MSEKEEEYGMGWLPDPPDFRDFTSSHSVVMPIMETIPLSNPGLPPKHDLSKDFPLIENQGTLGSCTAQAGVALIEYFERIDSVKRDPYKKQYHVDASRLFLYKVTRNLMGVTG